MFKKFFTLIRFHLLKVFFHILLIHEVANFMKGKRIVSVDSMINSPTWYQLIIVIIVIMSVDRLMRERSVFHSIDILLPAFSMSLSGKKSKSVFDFLTYSRETGFSFSYAEVEHLFRLNVASNEIDRVSKFDNSLSFGAKQNALRQIFFALWFF